MKAILSYENYYSYGKKYQVKFIYENELEAKYIIQYITKFIYENESETKRIISYLKPSKEKNLIMPYYSKIITKNKKTINIIEKTNIPKELLISFITMLISINNCKVIIDNKELIDFNINNINDSIDNLHINANLNKGDFFNLGNTYYMTFKYANDDQENELSYYFNCKLNYNESNGIYPIAIDKFGNLTNKNNGTIRWANIPKDKLSSFIKTFIEEYNMIITIGNKKIKDEFNEEKLNEALSIFNKEKEKTRTRTKTRY